MKKINIIITIVVLALFVVSCETYDDYNTDRAAVAGFLKRTENINNVPSGGTRERTVDLYISDISSSDRTFPIIAIAADTLATGPENYTFDSTVTFPANTREASIQVVAVDNTITNERSFFILSLDGGEDAVSGTQILIGLRN
jgi:hypothetical protein